MEHLASTSSPTPRTAAHVAPYALPTKYVPTEDVPAHQDSNSAYLPAVASPWPRTATIVVTAESNALLTLRRVLVQNVSAERISA